MYACMHVCMYACMHVCMYACMHVCMYPCIHVCMYACMHVCMYACMHVCMYACMHVGRYVRACVRTYVCMYIYDKSLYRGKMATGMGKDIVYGGTKTLHQEIDNRLKLGKFRFHVWPPDDKYGSEQDECPGSHAICRWSSATVSPQLLKRSVTSWCATVLSFWVAIWLFQLQVSHGSKWHSSQGRLASCKDHIHTRICDLFQLCGQ